MATPPVRTEISDTYPNPTNAVARAGFGKLYDYVTGLLGSTGNQPEACAAIGAVARAGGTGAIMTGDLTLPSINSSHIAGTRNKVINGNFSINQRGVSGTVALSAGQYGHDRFKAGASGCTYTFSTTANVTTITISSGSLLQAVEGVNLESGTWALSWTGTSQGKINGGTYSASGVTASITGGANATLEFNSGTLGKVQFEKGTTPTVFEQRIYTLELQMCQRYFETCFSSGTTPAGGVAVGRVAFVNMSATQTNDVPTNIVFRVTKRAAPTMTQYASVGNTVSASFDSIGTQGGNMFTTLGANAISFSHWTADAEI